MKRILFIVGSYRKHSFNHQLAQQLIQMIGHRAEASILDYQDVPFFNEDIEYPIPDSVAKVKEKISESDALWIISPEYNGQIPGILKNLLDWLSRPVEKGNWSKGSIVKNKTVLISSAAGKSAGANVRASLASLLKAMRMNLIHQEGVGIALSNVSFTNQNLIFNQKEKDLFEQQIQKCFEVLNKIPE